MSNDNTGRTSRPTSGKAPMGSTVAIVVTAVALLLGFLILRKVNDDSTSSTTPDNSDGTEQTLTTDLATSSTSAQSSTTSTTLVFTGTKVQVANASTQTGVAGQMSLALEGAGFDTVDATNSANGLKVDPSKVLYDAANPLAQAVAESVALVLGGLAVEEAPTPPPIEPGGFADGSGVILLLGDDIAGKTIAQINQVPSTGTTMPPTASTG